MNITAQNLEQRKSDWSIGNYMNGNAGLLDPGSPCCLHSAARYGQSGEGGSAARLGCLAVAVTVSI